jgi:Fic family protein
MDTPFNFNPQWHDEIDGICALLERVIVVKEQSEKILRLRKTNRILSIQATAAIEGNRLTIEQVSAIVDGKPVWGPPQDIKEIQNALSAYKSIPNLEPFNINDFLKTHQLITNDLIHEAGQFRTVNVVIINDKKERLHTGAHANDVPDLIAELFEWGKCSEEHPLLISSAVHFMIEHIHPFRDGNGRIGRLWQTLLLYKWNTLFEWIPIETLIHHNQQEYYKALQTSRMDGIDARLFIDFMLKIIKISLQQLESEL